MALGITKAYTPAYDEVADESAYNTDIASLFNAFSGLEAQTSTLGGLTITPSSNSTTRFRVNNAAGTSLLSCGTDTNDIRLNIVNAGTGDAIQITQSGNGVGLDLNKTGTGAGNAVDIENDGTNNALSIKQDGVLATTNYGLYVYSNAVQNTSNTRLALFHMDNASSDQPVIEILNDGTGTGLYVNQEGIGVGLSIYNAGASHGFEVNQEAVLNTLHYGLYVYSNAVQNTSNTSLSLFHMDNASSDQPVIEIDNDGSGNTISDSTGAVLSAAGAWTDAPSCYANKENISEITDTKDYLTKLKKLKLFRFKKKVEINKIGDKAPQRKGFILDDNSTPEDLIARDCNGAISGISSAQIGNFVLGVCKELIKKVNLLERKLNI